MGSEQPFARAATMFTPSLKKLFASGFLLALATCGSEYFAQSRLFAATTHSDTDGDGVPAILDECPNSEPSTFDNLNASGCADGDDDGDGILNTFDLCKSTPAGEKVQRFDGCMPYYYSASGVVYTKGDDGNEYADGYVVNPFEMNAGDAIKLLLETMPKQEDLASNQRIGDVKATKAPLPNAQESGCAVAGCDGRRPQVASDLGAGSGVKFPPGSNSNPQTPVTPGSSSSGTNPSGTTVDSPSSGTVEVGTTPALPPGILAGASLTAPLIAEDLGQELVSQGFETTADQKGADRLMQMARAQMLTYAPYANQNNPQVAQIVGSISSLGRESLRQADKLFSSGNESQADAYLYLSAVFIDAVYDIGNTDIIKKLDSAEEVASVYRNLYQGLTGRNMFADEVLSDDDRAQEILAVVNGPVGKQILGSIPSGKKVESFGLVLKAFAPSLSQDEASVDAVITQAIANGISARAP